MSKPAFEVKDLDGKIVGTGRNAYDAQKKAEEEANRTKAPMTVWFLGARVADVAPQPARRPRVAVIDRDGFRYKSDDWLVGRVEDIKHQIQGLAFTAGVDALLASLAEEIVVIEDELKRRKTP